MTGISPTAISNHLLTSSASLLIHPTEIKLSNCIIGNHCHTWHDNTEKHIIGVLQLSEGRDELTTPAYTDLPSCNGT